MEGKGMEEKARPPLVKNVFYAVAIAVGGFILLNLTFLLDFLFQSALRAILMPNPEIADQMMPPTMHLLFVLLVLVVSWFVLRSRMKPIIKATFLTVPAAVVFATVGMILYTSPMLVYVVGAAIFIGAIWYLHRTKQTWLYYYSITLVAAVMLIMGLAGVDI